MPRKYDFTQIEPAVAHRLLDNNVFVLNVAIVDGKLQLGFLVETVRAPEERLLPVRRSGFVPAYATLLARLAVAFLFVEYNGAPMTRRMVVVVCHWRWRGVECTPTVQSNESHRIG